MRRSYERRVKRLPNREGGSRFEGGRDSRGEGSRGGDVCGEVEGEKRGRLGRVFILPRIKLAAPDPPVIISGLNGCG